MELDLAQIEGSGCAANEPYALRVLGDSMEPEFADGCIIIIDPAGVVASGAYVVARINGEPLFRQYQVEAEHHFLKPVNPGYDPLEIEGPSAIIGVITQRAGTRRHHRRHYN